MASMAEPRPGDAGLQKAGAITFDYGNNIRAQAQTAGVADAFDFPGFVPALHPAALLRGQGAVPLGGALRRPEGHPRHRPGLLELFPENESLRRWIEMAEARVPFQGLPARICWLGYGERAKAGLAFNELVRRAPSPRRSSSAATTSTRARLPRPTARRNRCGRLRRHRRLAAPKCAGQHRVRARAGSRFTTAAAPGSGTLSMPGWSSWPTAPTSRRRSWSGS
jgi:hypothetical protein